MSELDSIQNALNQTAQRRRWLRIWNGFFTGLFWAACAWLLFSVAFKLLPIPFATLGVAALVAAGLVVFGVLRGGWRRESKLETARWVDQQLGTKERLSAALEFSEKGGEWGGVIVRSAAKYVNRIEPHRMLRFELPRLARWTVLVLFAGATLGFVPEYRSKAFLDAEREAEVIKETGQQLSSFAKRALVHRPPKMKPTEKAMVALDELGEKLTKARLTRDNALAEIASVTEKLRKENSELGKNPAMKRLREAARNPSGSANSSAKALQQKMDALRKQMEGALGDPDTLQKLKDQMKALQRAASGLNTPDGGLSPEMQQQMSDNMASLSQMAENAGLSLPELEKAMEALKAGQVDQFLKSLDMAQVNLDKMMEMAKALQKMQNQMDQVGKSLAEQLEKGQAQAAHDRLVEMTQKVQSGQTDLAEMQKLLQELADALDPAGDYGEVQSLLKAAMQNGQSGDKQAMAKNMMAAAAELQKLMDQFGDMQSLMASLDALQKAQLCVGNCMGWGQCKGTGNRIGAGKGGKPGKGYGTWAEENSGWFYPEMSDLWDNGEEARPEMEGRGHTDRGQGELGGMVPTKVKGNFNPGGPMPSITLKGLSIKGESRVEIQEAVSSAQSEAQSALGQQKIPRAYQDAVRNYFDDLSQ